MIKANDLQDYRPITSYQNGNEITLTSVKNAIKNCASEKGIPVAFENDQVKSGGLFNSEIEDCIIVYHPEHERDYFKFCIRVKHEGMYAFVIVQTFGRSSQMAKANREEFARADREGKSTSYKIGSMVSEKLFNIGKSKSKYENELMYYQCICDMFDEVIS